MDSGRRKAVGWRAAAGRCCLTVSLSGSSPIITALPVAAPAPPEPEPTPSVVPSVQGEYWLPSAAQQGYHVSPQW